MRRFITLLKKELREQLTWQMILPFLLVVLVFLFIGNLTGKETKKALAPQKIAVLDEDRTPVSQTVIDSLTQSNFNVRTYTGITESSLVASAKNEGIATALVIPAGFEAEIAGNRSQPLTVYNIIRNFSFTGSVGNRVASQALDTINEALSNQLIAQKISGIDPLQLKKPVFPKNFVIIGARTAAVSPDQVTGFIMSQTTFLPIVMFLVIVIAAQMIAVSVAAEKENKTLETLLSTPISRTALVFAKMTAAGIVSLMIAVIYMFGFRYYMNGVTGFNAGEAFNPEMAAAIQQLGLMLDLPAYILLGISLFLSILIALAISLILGASAEDVKKAQGLVAPITFLIMIPYFLTMFIDLEGASPLLKYFVYFIPFSHPFLAAPNLFIHNYLSVIYGILYQTVFFMILVAAATRIFATDRILTLKLNFKKSGFK